MVSHYIYLSRDERYKLHHGETVETVGVSVPVWFKKGSTSEPAQELFCKYKLTNNEINRAITTNEEGYAVNLPQKLDLQLSPGLQVMMGLDLPTSDRLLDVRDGGSEWLQFRQYGKMHRNKKAVDVVHFVEIKKLEDLEESMN